MDLDRIYSAVGILDNWSANMFPKVRHREKQMNRNTYNKQTNKNKTGQQQVDTTLCLRVRNE